MAMVINYPNGYMTVELDAFFPAAQPEMKRLKSIIRMSDHQEEHIQEIEAWFDENLDEMADYAEHCSEQAAEHTKGLCKASIGTEQYRRHDAARGFYRKEGQRVGRLIQRLNKNRDYMLKEEL